VTRKEALPWITGGVGLAVALIGIAVFAAANRHGSPADFGWYAYAPLEPGAGPYSSSWEIVFGSDSWQVLWTGGHLLGAGLVVAGLLVLAASGGFLLGRGLPQPQGSATGSTS
jgi:hypothetical protein